VSSILGVVGMSLDVLPISLLPTIVSAHYSVLFCRTYTFTCKLLCS